MKLVRAETQSSQATKYQWTLPGDSSITPLKDAKNENKNQARKNLYFLSHGFVKNSSFIKYDITHHINAIVNFINNHCVGSSHFNKYSIKIFNFSILLFIS